MSRTSRTVGPAAGCAVGSATVSQPTASRSIAPSFFMEIYDSTRARQLLEVHPQHELHLTRGPGSVVAVQRPGDAPELRGRADVRSRVAEVHAVEHIEGLPAELEEIGRAH